MEIKKFKNRKFHIEIFKLMKGNLNTSPKIMIQQFKNIHGKRFKKLFNKYKNKLIRVIYEEIDIDYLG